MLTPVYESEVVPTKEEGMQFGEFTIRKTRIVNGHYITQIRRDCYHHHFCRYVDYWKLRAVIETAPTLGISTETRFCNFINTDGYARPKSVFAVKSAPRRASGFTSNSVEDRLERIERLLNKLSGEFNHITARGGL